MDYHEIASIFPMMGQADYEALREDIRKNGLREPIVLYDGKILDGRNRWRACQELGIEPQTTTYTGDDPVGYVMSMNLHRRHLTADQRAAIAVEALPMYEAEARKRKQAAGQVYGRGKKDAPKMAEPISRGEARDVVAEKLHVTHTYVSDLKRIKRDDPATFEAIKRGGKRLAQVKREQQIAQAIAEKQARIERAQAMAKSKPHNPRQQIIHGEALATMDRLIDEGVRVDAVICDLPYGTTACPWDVVIPLDDMWDRLRRIVRPDGVIALFGTEPFSSRLRMSNIDEYRYDWIWDKGRGYNFAAVKYQPFKAHEIISIFSRERHRFFPQMIEGKPYAQRQGYRGEAYGGDNGREIVTVSGGDRYPLSILRFPRQKSDIGDHPTQKPVALMEYLIQTYTEPGDLVLDFAAGSGTTGVACIHTGRDYILIEKSDEYVTTAQVRVYEAKNGR